MTKKEDADSRSGKKSRSGPRGRGDGTSPNTSPRSRKAKSKDAPGEDAGPASPGSSSGKKKSSKERPPAEEPEQNGDAERIDNEAVDQANGDNDVDRLSDSVGRLSDARESDVARAVPPPQPFRTTTIAWDQVVAVGALIVPVCKEHGMGTMQFRKGTGDDATSIDMSDLLDWVRESRAVGAKATCAECGAACGTIMKKGDKGAPSYFGPDSPAGPRLSTMPSWLPAFCVGCDLSLGHKEEEG